MKKISFLAGAALMLTLGFTSCNQVDNPVHNYEKYDILTYNFTAAANAGENPENLNGSAANGQAFFGWEKSDKTDSKRQDYKGYKWAEGSVLPEECHVWRRSDRINNNVVQDSLGGGLKCPNEREMAIDGLAAGSYVEIYYYDATNPTESTDEILWAIGDGSSDETLGGVRATATIEDILSGVKVEAVTGETTIPSGARINVTSVTPADKGTGYIVVKVRKNMVISKILVANPKQAE